MRQLAIYGKGGIGKSMVSSHISFGIADRGLKIMHVGCDPKHDSTRLLLRGKMPKTVLDTLRRKNFDVKAITRDEIVFASPLNEECRERFTALRAGGRTRDWAVVVRA